MMTSDDWAFIHDVIQLFRYASYIVGAWLIGNVLVMLWGVIWCFLFLDTKKHSVD